MSHNLNAPTCLERFLDATVASLSAASAAFPVLLLKMDFSALVSGFSHFLLTRLMTRSLLPRILLQRKAGCAIQSSEIRSGVQDPDEFCASAEAEQEETRQKLLAARQRVRSVQTPMEVPLLY